MGVSFDALCFLTDVGVYLRLLWTLKYSVYLCNEYITLFLSEYDEYD